MLLFKNYQLIYKGLSKSAIIWSVTERGTFFVLEALASFASPALVSKSGLDDGSLSIIVIIWSRWNGKNRWWWWFGSSHWLENNHMHGLIAVLHITFAKFHMFGSVLNRPTSLLLKSWTNTKSYVRGQTGWIVSGGGPAACTTITW